jgi:twinkle protein
MNIQCIMTTVPESIGVNRFFNKNRKEFPDYHGGLYVLPDPTTTAESVLKDFKFLTSEDLGKTDRFIFFKPIGTTPEEDKHFLALETELIRRLGIEKCFYLQKTMADIFQAVHDGGLPAVESLLSEAHPYPVEGIFTMVEAAKNLIHYYDHGLPRGKKLSWKCMENFYSVRRGEWTVITGVPGHGKSEFVDAMMIDLAMNHDWKFGMYSPENFPYEMHAAKLLEKWSSKSFSRWHEDRMTKGKMLEGVAWLNESFFYIMPSKPTLDDLLEKTRILVVQKGIHAVVLDPWNEIEHSRPKDLSETEYISLCLTKVRKFARMNNIHVWFVAHPRKVEKDKNGQRAVPDPYDIAGSAAWRSKADNCLCVWRDVKDKEGMVEIHVQKVRHKIVGHVGLVKLGYDIITGQYYDPAETPAPPESGPKTEEKPEAPPMFLDEGPHLTAEDLE